MAKKAKSKKQAKPYTPTPADKLADAVNEIGGALTSTAPNAGANGRPVTLTDAVAMSADNLEALTESVHRLGLNSALTGMGAIELLAKEVMEGTIRIASAIESLAAAVKQSGK